jgi:hypothetical protein
MGTTYWGPTVPEESGGGAAKGTFVLGSRLFRCLALVALAVSAFGVSAAGAVPAKSQDHTWIGQIQRHGNHYDYVGQPCPVGEGMLCANYVARYRVDPQNNAARWVLARVSGGQARLLGQLTPARKPGPYQGTLRVHSVQAWPPPPGASGVEGTVTAAPTCPVARPGQPCTRPVDAAIQLLRAGGSAAANGHSDAKGRFRIAAPEGHYDLVVDFSGPSGKCSAPVDVTAGSFTHTDVKCDTGIR